MSLRVLLIYPPSHTQNHTSCPAGLLYLAATLERAGHDVLVIDANAACRQLSADDVVAQARQYQPDCIGMTIVTQLALEAYRLASRLREIGAPLIAGGPHPSLVPEEPLDFGFDAVCVGEGEPVIVQAAEALAMGSPLDTISGLVFRNSENQVRMSDETPPIESLDDVPLPARHLIRPEDFRPDGHPNQFGNIFGSRGCPCRCSYCAGGLFGRRFRYRTPSNVLAEICMVYETFGTTHFHFVDDSMTLKRQRAIAICEGIKSLNLPVTWSMMTAVNVIDDDLLALAAESNCTRIDYGIESGHPETLKNIHKPHNVEMVRRTVAATRGAGISPSLFFIVGFPWETPEHIDATLSLMKELSPYLDSFYPALASILVPFPGTELYDTYKDQYDLHQWWLKPERTFGVPQPGRHAYYEEQFYTVGAVLDANFFRYSPEVRGKIFETFRFMHRHNNSVKKPIARLANNGLIDLSHRLWRLSPKLETSVMSALRRLPH